jgi:selenide,water dikinase
MGGSAWRIGMHSQSTPIVKDLVLLGGGHSHVIVLKRLGMNPIPGVRITVICRDVHTPYSGMLPGLIAGHYSYDEAHIDLRPLTNFAGARFIHASATGLDPEKRLIKFEGRPAITYDLLSINLGSSPGFGNVPGAEEFAVPVKPISNFLPRWAALVERVMSSDERPRIAVVGAGAGGVELTLAIQFRLRQLLAEAGRSDQEPEIHLFSGTRDVLATHNQRVRAKFKRVLAERNVQVHGGTRVAEVTEGCLRTESGFEQRFHEIVWVTSASATPWLAESGLACDAEGFVKVDDCLRSLSHPAAVFSAGDVAAVVNHAREKAGVFAVRQGPPLEENLRRVLNGESPRPFQPQRKFLSLISTGDKYAVSSRGSWSIEAKWVWDWKDWIDRRFMEKFSELPEMAPTGGNLPSEAVAGKDALQALSASLMRCKGCGSKLGASVLDRVLADIEPFSRPDVPTGFESRDDAAIVEVPVGKVQVQSIDFFPAIVDDPYVFGRIAANHALGDIYAMGAEPQAALAVAGVPFGTQEKTEDVLRQLLLGANSVLREAGATLAGGHSSETSEMSLGFSVSGLARREQILSKGGLRVGDALILTKPIGTGALFAADAQRRAKGRWIAAAVEVMQQSARAASDVFRQHRASACTDVTGFGLMGHLLEMLRSSENLAELFLADVPILDGALECVQMGIFSSLQPENLKLKSGITNADEYANDARYLLLFDPQTAGGLLAGVPEGSALNCIEDLKLRGYAEAAIVGRVTDGGSEDGLVTLRDAG